MCPVCRASFRGSTRCFRCGADLSIIMRLQTAAWRLREAARDAIREGDPNRAHALATKAQEIYHTTQGSRLKFVAVWLQVHGNRIQQPHSERLESV